MDMTFDRSVAPGLMKCGEEGHLIAAEMQGEAGQSAGSRGALLLWPRRVITLPDEAMEFLRHCCERSDLRKATVQFIQKRRRMLRLF